MSIVSDNRRDIPLVSIIVPIYNMEAYLNRCLTSIQNQTFSDYEIILVDDGSTDGSPEICDCYAEKHSEVIVIHKANGGLSAARLAGFDIARGKYILFIDSDDFIHEEMLYQLVESMKENHADLTICGYFIKNGDNIKPVSLSHISTVLEGREAIINKYIKPLFGTIKDEAWIPGFLWIRLMKRDLIERNFFRSEQEYFMEDHVFDLLYADHIKKISIIHAPLYYYCVNANSLTNRYREHKWGMLSNLYNFYVKYIDERKIMDCNRNLDIFLLSSFCSAVDNAVLLGSYRSFRRELDGILKTSLIKNIKSPKSIRGIPSTYRLTYNLIRLRLYYLLFFIRRMRLK